ncbi:hypothetical protein [Leptospira sp. 'Mane']|uniref:hypothetical protein n=1 Tax=Leptospira sp. 'Mane' TaxID=3387407 RepID=UPI00398AB994
MTISEKANLSKTVDSLFAKKFSLSFSKPSGLESLASLDLLSPTDSSDTIVIEKERGILSWFLDFHNSFLGRCFTFYLILTIITQTFDFAELLADPPFRTLWKQGSDGKLNNFYERAEKQQTDEDGWNETVERGRNILRTEWEMLAEREIEEKLRTSEDKANAELELRREKELARADWEVQVDDEIQNKRGEWKAKQAASGLGDLLDSENIDIDGIKSVIAAARENALYGSSTDERILMLDSYLNVGIGMIRGSWEAELDAKLQIASASGTSLTGKEKLAFDEQLASLREQFLQGYSYIESMFSGQARSDFIGKENRSTDLQNAIAQETDPRALTLLLIEDVKRRIGEDGKLILQNTEGASLVTFTGDGEDFQKQVEAAYELGQKKWKNAIDVLIAQKLTYDEKAEADKKTGNDAWVEAYQKLLDARKDWQKTINTQIEQGIAAWDSSEIELQANKGKALDELERYTKAAQDGWESHLSGLGNIVMGSSATVGQIKENIRWFTDARTKMEKNLQTDLEAYTVYGQQLAYWQGLESKYRNIIASAESQVNATDMRGVGGFLTNSGNGIMSSAEYELKLALKEKDYLEKIKNEAEAVYNYAINNQGKTKEDIAAELALAKTAYEDQEKIYLEKLRDLNGSGALSISTPGIDPASGSGSASSTTPAASQTSLDVLNNATKALQESAKELEVARAELEASRESYNRALKTQILLNNPSLLGDIGSIKNDLEGYSSSSDGGLRQDIKTANEEIQQATERIRMQEKLYYQEQYERQNALRSNGFYLDSSRRIQSFEDLKDKKLILAAVVGTTDDVSLKIQSLLTSDVLVQIYGNEVATAIKEQLTKIKADYDGSGATVVTSVTAFNTQLPKIQTEHNALLSKLSGNNYTSLTSFSSTLESGITELKKIPGMDEAIGLSGLGTFRQNWQTDLALWDDKKSGYTDAYDDYADAYNSYKTYADSHVGQESSLEYQTKLLDFTTALSRYQTAAATLETYLDKVSGGVSSLRSYTNEMFVYASSYVDGKYTGQTRTNYLNSVSSEKTKYTTSLGATTDPLKSINENLASLADQMNKQGSFFNDYMTVTEAKYRKYETANGMLVQLYDGLEANYQVEKKSLEFLLSESGSLSLLESKRTEIEGKGKEFGATVNYEAIKILEEIFPANLAKADRRVDIILAKITNDLNAKLSKSSIGDESERIRIEALKAVRVFLSQNGAYLASAFSKDEDYAGFVSDFAKEKTQADNLLQFYQSGGAISDAEKARIKLEGTEEERRRLYDYYNYGSGFTFSGVIGQSMNAYSGMMQGISVFVDDVKNGRVASILSENYFKGQENRVTGILKELEDRFPEFASVTSSLLYNDYVSDPEPTDRDPSEENRRKNILADALAGMTLNEKLQKLQDINFLVDVFGEGEVPGIVKKDIQNYVSSLASAEAGITGYGASINTSLTGVDANWSSALAITNPAEKTYYTGLKTGLDQFLSWKNQDDLFQPVYDPDTGVVIPNTYVKPFASLDFGTFQVKSLSYATEVAKWDTEAAKLTTAKTTYDTKLAAFRAYETANPTDKSSTDYIAKLDEVKVALIAVQEAVRNNQSYQQSLHSLYTDAFNASKVLVSSMKTIRGFDSTKILYYQGDLATNSDLQNMVTSQPSYFTMTNGFNEIDRELGRLDTAYSAREGDLANKEITRTASVTLIDDALGAGKRDIVGYSDALTNKTGLISSSETYISNTLPGKVIAFMPVSNTDHISQEELVGYVKNLRTFFLEKQFKGEEVNSALLEALEKAGAITDEIENLQYYRDNRGRTKDEVIAALATAKSDSEAMIAGANTLQEAWGILAGADASGAPLYASNEALQKFLVKYDDAKLKLGVNVSPALEAKITELKTESWEMYKRSLANYYLGGGWLAEGQEMSLTAFITGLRAGNYVVEGNTASKPKFLGQELTSAQFDALKEYLRPMDAKLRILNTDVITDLTALLANEDADLRSELGDYALEVTYQKINAGLEQGFSMMGAVPDALKQYSIIASFDAFLANDATLSKDIANDRTLAKSKFLLQIGADAATTAILNDYLSNYTTRNSSYYLPDELKTAHLYESFFYKKPMDGTDLSDMTKLTAWLNQEKYDPSMLASVKAAARARYIRSNYYGEGLKEYLQEIDNSLTTAFGTGLSGEEKQSFILELGGVGDPLGFYKLDPSGLVAGEMVLNNYNYSPEYEEIGGLFKSNTLSLAKKIVEGQSLVRKETYARDIVTKAKVLESYESYQGIAYDRRGYLGMAAPSEADIIDDKLTELERIAEDKLGGFFAVLQEYNSNAYNNNPGYEVNLSIKRTIDAIDDDYEIKDEQYTKDPIDGTYSFKGALDNVLQRISSYVNANTPGFRSGVTDPSAVIQGQEANLRAQKETVISAGKMIVQLTGINPSTVLNDIQATKNEFSTRESVYTTAKGDYDDKLLAVTTAQTNYNNALTETTTEYNTMLNLEKNYSLKKSLYEYATIADYNQKNPGTENASQTSYLAIITKRFNDAKTALESVVKKVTDLQTKVANQVTLNQLQNDPYVKENKAQAEDWAAKAIKFSAAEDRIKDRIVQLNQEINMLQNQLDSQLYGILGPTRSLPYNSLDGFLDFSSAAYLQREDYERYRARITEGLLAGKIGTWDFVYGNQGGGDTYSGGLTSRFPELSLQNYFGQYGEKSNGEYGGGLMIGAARTMKDVWFLDHARDYATMRRNSNDAAAFNNAMTGAFNNAMGAEAIIIAFMGFWNPTTFLMAASRRTAADNAFNSLGNQLGQVANAGATLKAKVAELQKITDISTVAQLREVLINTGGLTAADLQITDSSGQTKELLTGNTLSQLKFEGGKETLGIDKIVGTNGKSVVTQRAIHDEYGYYVRSGVVTAGGITAGVQALDSYGRATSLMTTGDEISDALANMARTQYEIERDEYYISAEQVVINGTKVDRKVVLDDREAFHAKILKDARSNSNINVEREMYRVLAADYFGEGKVADEIAQISFAQNEGLQLYTWEEKEKEFYNKKNQWLENIAQLKKAGESQFDSMLSNFVGQWDSWKTEFDAKTKAGAEEYYLAIEEKLKGQKAWATDFLKKSQDGSDKQLLVQLYESIDTIIEQTRRNLPNDVSLNVNVNDILSNVLKNRPTSFDVGIAMAGKEVDTNFFMNEIRNSNFDNSLTKTYEGLQEGFQNATKKMQTLQTLDILYTLPKGFDDAIQAANRGELDALQQEMLGSGYLLVGNVFARTIVVPAGGSKFQYLPNYVPYKYTPPTTYPSVTDSSGKTWALNETDKLMSSGMEAIELEQLVKLAITKMNDDFQLVYNPATKVNYEKDLALFGGGVDFSGSFNEITSQIGENVHENLQEAGGDILNSLHSTGSGMGCTGSHDECLSSATNSMYLVGEVEGGDWGKNKFTQLYMIRKLKEDQEREKGMNEATNSRRKIGLTNLYQGTSAVIQGVKQVVEGVAEVTKDGFNTANKMLTNPAKYSNELSDPASTFKQFIKDERNSFQDIENGGRLFAAGAAQIQGPQSEAIADIFTQGNRSYDVHKVFDRIYEQSESQIRDSEKYGSIQRETARVSDNMIVLDVAVYVAAVAVSILTLEPFLGAAMIAGYQGWKGAYEGGGAGMILGAASGFANGYLEGTGLNINASYSFANGFGAGVDYGFGVDKNKGGFGAQLGASWSEKEGFGVSAGVGYFAPGGAWSARAGVKTTQRGGNTYSASAGVTSNGMIYGANAFYNDQTHSYGGGATATYAPGGQNSNMVSNSSGNSVTAGMSWTNGQGFSAVGDFQYWSNSWGAAPQSMSDLFSLPGDINPRSSGSSQATPEAARRNLLGDIVDGLGSVFSGMWNGAKNLFGVGTDSDIKNRIDSEIQSLELEIKGLSEVAGPPSANSGLSDKTRRLEQLKALKSGKEFSWESAAGNVDDDLNWDRVDLNGLNSKDKRYTQNLANGVQNRYETIETDGKVNYYVNGKLLQHGDAVVVGIDGLLEVVPQSKLADYIKKNNITNLNATINGVGNTGLDAVKMGQASALTINGEAARTGNLMPQLHIFNDGQVASNVPDGYNFNKPDVQNTLRILADAGAFSQGGTIVAHSAGARNVSAFFAGLPRNTKIEADVLTFGGVHTTSYPDRANSWVDFYNPNDNAIAIPKNDIRWPEYGNIGSPTVVRDNSSSSNTYNRVVNGQSNSRFTSSWNNQSTTLGGTGSLANHSFLYNYEQALRLNYPRK